MGELANVASVAGRIPKAGSSVFSHKNLECNSSILMIVFIRIFVETSY